MSAVRTGVVWVVASGSYSDYRVLCACESKADADLLAARIRTTGNWRRDDARVESLPLVRDPNVQRVEILSLQVNIWDDGTTTEDRLNVRVEWPFDALFDDAVPVQWRWVRAPIHHNKGGRLEVSGTDHERVRKTFSDRRAEILTDDALRAKTERRGRR